MAKVRVLSDQVANQIAAGEVIERPASVVKELIENSIDAGATRIEVEFRKGGASLMRIEDNGEGMSKDDALLSLERHATSKISSAKDLDTLATMGFRGEALPSIASVSRFQLQTRGANEDNGTEIVIDGGRMIHARDCGMPQGTRISVSRLFSTVPARRKFLKSVPTESAHIVHCVRLYALAHPEIGFTLIDDGRVLFESPACPSAKDRIAEIFGKQVAGGLIEIDKEEGGMRLHGFIGKPSLSRSSRHEMLFFVNHRPVENRTLSYALVESYYGHIPKGRYPVAFLFLDTSPEGVDVNVHPAKREIRFREEAKARGFAVRTILGALRGETEATRSIRPVPLKQDKEIETATHKPEQAKRRLISTRQSIPDSIATGPRDERPQVASASAASTRDTPVSKEEKPESGTRANWEFIGWAQGEFALFDTGSGVILLNARAAQQRILYERMLKDFESDSAHVQRLLLAQPVEFDPVSAALVQESLSFFKQFGFEIEPFGRNFYRIEGTPTWLDEKEAEPLLREIVGMLRQGSLSNEKESVAAEMVAKRAALKAVPETTRMDRESVERCVEQLFNCEKPLTDPDGRPSLIEISAGELDRRFHRRDRRPQAEFF